jgi:hypothetical protein
MPFLRRAKLTISYQAALTGLTLAALFAAAAAAQAQDADPPSRVGRISVLEGTVSLHANPNDPWSGAVINYPIAQSGSLWTEPGGKAEIELGGARVRLDGGTELDITELDDENVALSVPQGRIDISVHDRTPDEHYVVQTPRGNVELNEDGRYRVVAGTQDEPTRIAAFHGLATVAEPQTQVTVNRNEEAVIGPGEPAGVQVGALAPDQFDRWSEDRDRQLYATDRPHYVSAGIPGAADLEQYGTWRDSPEYGHVWMPTTVDAGWAPYREGHWAFVAPWGWTWVDDAPWGFAPFHYGRWAQIDGGWGWIPGEVVVHPVYAPALVAWVGNPGIAVGVGGVAVGWIPLGPREVWVPPYHTSIDYVRNVNVTNVNRTVINNITVNNIHTFNDNANFVNRQHVTVVSQQTFASAAPVHRALLPVNAGAIAQMHAGAGAGLPQPSQAARFAAPARPSFTPPAAPLATQHPIQPIHGPATGSNLVPHPGTPPVPANVPHPGTVPEPAGQHPPVPTNVPHPSTIPEPTGQHPPVPTAPTPQAVPTPHVATPPNPGFHPPAGSPPAETHGPAEPNGVPHPAPVIPQPQVNTPHPPVQPTPPNVPHPEPPQGNVQHPPVQPAPTIVQHPAPTPQVVPPQGKPPQPAKPNEKNEKNDKNEKNPP